MKKSKIILLLFFLSCVNPQEKLKLKLESKLTEYYNDQAFKKNGRIKIYKLQVLNIDTVNENSLDSVRKNRVDYLLNSYSSLVSAKIEVLKLDIEMEKLNRAYSPNNVQFYVNKFSDEKEEIKRMMDTVKFYTTYDSILNEGLKNNERQSFLKAEVNEKYTYYIDNDSTNALDTSFYFFDLNCNVININEKLNSYLGIKN